MWFSKMFLLRLFPIWALIFTVDLAPQWLNPRFERRVIQLNETNSTEFHLSTDKSNSVGNQDQEQITHRQEKFPTVILQQELQPPSFGILNKLPYLILQPPFFALPQQLTDDVLEPLPGPASNSVELKKRSKNCAQEENCDEIKETSTDPESANDDYLESTVILPKIKLTTENNLETSNGDSTTNLELPNETPTTEIIQNDLSSTVLGLLEKESEDITVNTKVINEIQTTFNDETAQSEENEFDDIKVISTSEFRSESKEYDEEFGSEKSTNRNLVFNTERIPEFTSVTTINNLITAQLNSILENSSENLISTTVLETLTSDRSVERITESVNKDELTNWINSRYELPQQIKTTPTEELITVNPTISHEDHDIYSTADSTTTRSKIDRTQSTELTDMNLRYSTIETVTSTTTTEADEKDNNKTQLIETGNINSRYGNYETTINTLNFSSESETKSIFSVDPVVESTQRSNSQVDLTEHDNSSYTTLQVEETTSVTTATNSESEDISKLNIISTTETAEFFANQVNLYSRYNTVPIFLDDSKEIVTTTDLISKSLCENNYVTDDIFLDEQSEFTQNAEFTTVSTDDLQLSNRVFISEGKTKDKENEQSVENSTVTVALTRDQNEERISETSNEEVEIKGIIHSFYSTSEQNGTSVEELVTVDTTTSNDGIDTTISTEVPSITSTDDASVIEPEFGQDVESKINNEVEVISVAHTTPLDNITSDVLVNYKTDGNDVIYTISTTIKSVLEHKSEEDGNFISEVNVAPNATSTFQNQNNTPEFPTSFIGNMSSISEVLETESENESLQVPNKENIVLELGKTNEASKIKMRLLPPTQSNLASVPNDLVRDSKLPIPIVSSTFNKENNAFNRNIFFIPNNTQPSETSSQNNNLSQNVLRSSFSDSGIIKDNVGRDTILSSSQFSINLNKSGTESNFSAPFNKVPKTIIISTDDRHNVLRTLPYNSESITESGNVERQMNHVSFIGSSALTEVERNADLSFNDSQYTKNNNRMNGTPRTSAPFSSVPNINVLGRQNVIEEKSSNVESLLPLSNTSVGGILGPNPKEKKQNSGIDIKKQIYFSSVINIGNNTPKTVRVNGNSIENKSSHIKNSNNGNYTNGNYTNGNNKFRSVTIDTSEVNDPTKLLKNYNKSEQRFSMPPQSNNLRSSLDKFVQAKYVGQTYVQSDLKSSAADAKTKDGFNINDNFKRKFGFDLSFLNRGSYSSRKPLQTEPPQELFNKPIRPRVFDRSNSHSSGSGTFGASIGPYRDTLIKYTGKGWSLSTYDKLILHTGLSGQYL